MSGKNLDADDPDDAPLRLPEAYYDAPPEDPWWEDYRRRSRAVPTLEEGSDYPRLA